MDNRTHMSQVAKINSRKQAAKKDYEDKSRVLLKENVEKKIKTTMIGSIATMEEIFGHLWGHKEGGPNTPEEHAFYNLFMEFRSQVMRNGNDNIRTFSEEIKRYSVVWTKHQINLKVVKNNKEGQENE